MPDIQSLEPLAETFGIEVAELIKSETMVENRWKKEKKNFIIALIVALLIVSIIFIIDTELNVYFWSVYIPFLLFASGIVLLIFGIRQSKRKRQSKAMIVSGIVCLLGPIMPALFMIFLLFLYVTFII